MIERFAIFAFEGIKRQRVRSWLTMLGVFIGIASVTTLISLGDAVNAALEKQFEFLGGNKIVVLPGGGGALGALFGGSSTLTVDDAEDLSRLASVGTAACMVLQYDKVVSRGESSSVLVLGLPSDESRELYLHMEGIEVVKGRDLKQSDYYSALAGFDLWSDEGDVFSKPLKARDSVTLGDRDFEVVGLLGFTGNVAVDSVLVIPYEAADDLFDREGAVDRIIVEVAPGFVSSKVAELVRAELRRAHDVEEGDEDFSVETSENVVRMVGGIVFLVQLVFIGVSMISLVVGAIGIMNTMYTSVAERTKQIGVLKAVGARDSQVLLIFLLESGFLGLVGGLVGALGGFAVAKLVDVVVNASGASIIFHVDFNPALIVSVLSFSFLVGVLSGVLPARQASRMNPVDALRHD